MDSVFIVHHLITIAALDLARGGGELTLAKIMLLLDISNIPMYVCKHYIEERKKAEDMESHAMVKFYGERLRLWKRIQFAVYVPIRCLGMIPFLLPGETNNAARALGVPIYLMGLVWTRRLYLKLE